MNSEPETGAGMEAPAGRLAFVTDLRALAFDEPGADEATIEVCRDGRWMHPLHGEIVIDGALRSSLERNFRLNVRRTGELPLDYDHEPGPAPGWITRLFTAGAGLFARVRFTPEGARRVRSGEYRFFSPEWHPNWVDPETAAEHGPTLFGGALTNRPFFRGMQAVCCADFPFSHRENAAGSVIPQGEERMPMEAEQEARPAVEQCETATAAEVRRMQDRIRILEVENAAHRSREEREELTRSLSEARWGEAESRLAPASLRGLVDALLGLPRPGRDAVAAAVRELRFVECGERGFAPGESESPLSAAEESLAPGIARSLGISVEEARRRLDEVKQQRAARLQVKG